MAADRAALVAAFGALALETQDIRPLMTEAANCAASGLGTRFAMVLEPRPEGDLLLVGAAGWPKEMIGRATIDGSGRSPPGRVLQTREPVLIPDCAHENEIDLPDILREKRIASLISVPIMAGADVFGVLEVDAEEARTFDSSDVDFLLALAHLLAAALRYASLALSRGDELFRQLAEKSERAVWISALEGVRLEYLSPAFEQIFGAPRENFLGGGRLIPVLVHPDDQASTRAAVRRMVTGETVVHEYRLLRPDGEMRWIRNTGFPIRDKDGQVRRVGGISEDITRQKHAEIRISEEQLRFRAVADLVPDLLWSNDPSGKADWYNQRWTDYTGRPVESALGLGWLDSIHPDDREQALAISHDVRANGEPITQEVRVRGADGIYRWFLSRAVPIHDAAGNISCWFGAATEIDEIKELQQRQHILVAELQHRTRNLIAIIRTIADRTFEAGPERKEFDARLAAMSRVQGFLARSDTASVDLSDLIRAELEALGTGAKSRVEISGPPVRLAHNQVQTLALVLHELATNAIKYGALAVEGARLRVTWTSEDIGDSTHRLRIEWRETGVPIAAAPKRRGYGRELIEQALPYQLGAHTSLDFRPDGVSCTIDLRGSFSPEADQSLHHE